jgi:diadenosine tetraphosphate (Ap4A) HIT family hydrolase
MTHTAIHDIVADCQTGENPAVVARMKSGWAVMGRKQVLPGYCLLLPDPVVPTLNDLTGDARAQFLQDMGRLGDAILAATDAVRINYEMLGNAEPALHAHLFARYAHEHPTLAARPIWAYAWDEAPDFGDEASLTLLDNIRRALNEPRHIF